VLLGYNIQKKKKNMNYRQNVMHAIPIFQQNHNVARPCNAEYMQHVSMSSSTDMNKTSVLLHN